MTDSWKRQVVPMKRQQRIIETSWARGYARVLYELKVPAEDIEDRIVRAVGIHTDRVVFRCRGRFAICVVSGMDEV